MAWSQTTRTFSCRSSSMITGSRRATKSEYDWKQTIHSMSHCWWRISKLSYIRPWRHVWNVKHHFCCRPNLQNGKCLLRTSPRTAECPPVNDAIALIGNKLRQCYFVTIPKVEIYGYDESEHVWSISGRYMSDWRHYHFNNLLPTSNAFLNKAPKASARRRSS